MVKDLNPGSGSGLTMQSISRAVLNGVMYFGGIDGSTGDTYGELYKTDGTSSGTTLIKDLCKIGSNGSDPIEFAAINNTVYFFAADTLFGFPMHGRLWKTDGTSAGTVKMSSTLWRVYGLTEVGGITYFNGNDGTKGDELYAFNSGVSIAAPTNLIGSVFKVAANYVQLDWTDNSNNELGFKIQRSTDGISFNTIDSVSTNIKTYKDISIAQKTLYYFRVFAYNSTSTSSYSNIVQQNTVGIKGQSDQAKVIQLFPNPVENNFSINNLERGSDIKISDLFGKTIYSQRFEGNIFTANVGSYKSGIYIVTITNGNEVMNIKLIKK